MYSGAVHSLSSNDLGPNGAAALAPGLAANGSLTNCDVRSNSIEGDGAQQLSAAVLSSKCLTIFSGIPLAQLHSNEITELDLQGQIGKRAGLCEALVLAALLRVNGSLTSRRRR